MSQADKNIREQLKRVRDGLAVQRAAKAEAMRERDAARDSFAGVNFADDVKITDTAEFKAAEQAVANVGRIDDQINNLEATEKGILKMLGADIDNLGNMNGGGSSDQARSIGWDGNRLLESSDEFRNAREAGVFNSTGRFGTVNLGQVSSREDFLSSFLDRPSAFLPAAPAGTVGTDQGAIRPDVRGIIPPYLLPLTLLDLIPTGTTDSNIVQYVQVTAIPGSAAETAELALKPEEGLTLNDATAPVRTIAGYIKMARQAMDDIPALATLINTLLPYDVRRRLMTQMLAGDGVGQNLLGILKTTGIGTPASAAGDNIADGILRAMTTIVLSDGDPNFVALHPLTWQSLLTMKAVDSGLYLYGQPAALQAQSIWGLRITVNRAIPQATPLVGDSMSATLLVREGVNVKTSDSDQDDFIRNRVTILAEARVAFPIWRPSGFAIAPLG